MKTHMVANWSKKDWRFIQKFKLQKLKASRRLNVITAFLGVKAPKYILDGKTPNRGWEPRVWVGVVWTSDLVGTLPNSIACQGPDTKVYCLLHIHSVIFCMVVKNWWSMSSENGYPIVFNRSTANQHIPSDGTTTVRNFANLHQINLIWTRSWFMHSYPTPDSNLCCSFQPYTRWEKICHQVHT